MSAYNARRTTLGAQRRYRTKRPADRDRSRATTHGRCAGSTSLLRAVQLVLVDIGPEIFDLGRVLDPTEGHPGARNHGLRIGDVGDELVVVPDDTGTLIGIGIIEARDAAGRAAVEAIERRPELDLGVLPDVVTRAALVERLLACCNILRPYGAGRGDNNRSGNNPHPHHSSPLVPTF